MPLKSKRARGVRAEFRSRKFYASCHSGLATRVSRRNPFRRTARVVFLLPDGNPAFSSSMMYRQASKAAARWSASTPTHTAASPAGSRPIRCTHTAAFNPNFFFAAPPRARLLFRPAGRKPRTRGGARCARDCDRARRPSKQTQAPAPSPGRRRLRVSGLSGARERRNMITIYPPAKGGRKTTVAPSASGALRPKNRH